MLSFVNIGLPVHRVEICCDFSRGTADPTYCHKDLHQDSYDNKNMINKTDPRVQKKEKKRSQSIQC